MATQLVTNLRKEVNVFNFTGVRPETKQKAIEALRARNVRGACSMCGSSNWAVLEIVSPLLQAEDGSTVFGGSTIPMLAIACTACSHIVHFSAVALGLISTTPSTVPPEGESK